MEVFEKKYIEAIEAIIKNEDISQAALARKLDMLPQTLGQILKGKRAPTIKQITKLFTVYGIEPNQIITGEDDGKVKGKVKGKVSKNDGNLIGNLSGNLTENEGSKNVVSESTVLYKTPKVITVDNTEQENIVFVDIKAQAGYLTSYEKPSYIKKLPTFNIPGFRNSTFRAFEVEGYSMLPYQGAGLYPKDLVIAKFVDNWKDIRDGRVYVIASLNDGVIIKRVINRLYDSESSVLICNSDNKNGDYPPILVNHADICEIWEFKAKISRQIPFPENLYDRLNRIEGEYAILKDRLDKMNGN